MSSFLCFGHQGAPGYAPENTLASFQKAIDLGVDGVELDIFIVDGDLVVIHDYRLERLTTGTGLVEEKTFDEIRSLEVKGGGKIPSLTEVLNLVNRRTSVNIEIKSECTAPLVANVINEYVRKHGWKYEQFQVSSFNHYELKTIKALVPEIKTGALIFGVPIGWAKFAADLNVYSINISIEFVNEELIEDAHRRGIKVFVFTVNFPDDIQRMIDLGVDGVFTDYPDRVIEIRSNINVIQESEI